MDEILPQLDDMKARWMAGGSVGGACPAEWRAVLGEQPDLDLLALAGQFLRIATRPTVTGAVGERPLLPQIALPALPRQARPLFLRAMETKGVDATSVVTLIAARGYAVSPFDWMPKPGATDIPDAYLPWLGWVGGAPQRHANDELPTADTWDDWSPQARLAAVEAMRQADPAAARALIAAIAPTLAAEQRLRLLSILAVALGEADEDYLATLLNDRSGKVQQLARQLLARLGRADVDADAQAELVGFFEVGRAGFVSRRTIATARKLKNAAQGRRRTELAALLPLKALADGLGMTAIQLIEIWSCQDGTDEIIAMTAATGSEAEVEALLGRLIEQHDSRYDISPLFERLPEATRLRIAPRIAQMDWQAFGLTLGCLGRLFGTLDYPTLEKSTTMTGLGLILKKQEADHAERQFVETALINLGFIATDEAAGSLVGDLHKAGLMAADPRLCLLRLNAALKETNT